MLQTSCSRPTKEDLLYRAAAFLSLTIRREPGALTSPNTLFTQSAALVFAYSSVSVRLMRVFKDKIASKVLPSRRFVDSAKGVAEKVNAKRREWRLSLFVQLQTLSL